MAKPNEPKKPRPATKPAKALDKLKVQAQPVDQDIAPPILINPLSDTISQLEAMAKLIDGNSSKTSEQKIADMKAMIENQIGALKLLNALTPQAFK